MELVFNSTRAAMQTYPGTHGYYTNPDTLLTGIFGQQAWDLTDAQRIEAFNVLKIVRFLFLAVSLPVTLCNIVVFLQRRMRSATSVYILGLSFAQVFFLSAHIIESLWSELDGEPRTGSSFCLFLLYAINFGSVVARRGCYTILCFVSMERLYAILRPLHVKEFVLSRFSAAVMLAIFAVTAVWHLYVPAKLKVIMALDETSSVMMCRFQVTDLYLRHKIINDSFSLVIKILMTYIALVLQIVLNIVTILALRRHNMAAKNVKYLANEEVRRQRERQLTVTILFTTIAFVTLSLPACLNGLLNIVIAEYNERGQHKNLASVVYNVCLDLQVLSCSVDFFCFFGLSSNYRKTFYRSFPCFAPAGVSLMSDVDSTRHTSKASTVSSP